MTSALWFYILLVIIPSLIAQDENGTSPNNPENVLVEALRKTRESVLQKGYVKSVDSKPSSKSNGGGQKSDPLDGLLGYLKVRIGPYQILKYF